MREFTQSKPLYQQAYDAIKEAILTGEIPSGSKVITTRLAEKFHVSSTPLRDALRQLTKEGLLIQSNLGIHVVHMSEKDYQELCVCRLMFEKEIIRLSIDHITDDKLKQAEDLLDIADKALAAGESQKVFECNTKFHEIINFSCPNKRLVQLIENVRSLLVLYRANVHNQPMYKSEIIDEHRRLLKALKEKNLEQALTEIENHLIKDKLRGEQFLTEVSENK